MKYLTLSLLLLAAVVVPASADTQALSTDEMFDRARSFAFDGKRLEARELLTAVLERSPDYYEVRVFLGRVYAWDRDYDNARAALRQVLQARPSDIDARSALVDVELWSGNYDQAELQADRGLGYAPGHTQLLFRKAQAQSKLGLDQQASQTAELALSTNPGRSDIRRLYYRILDKILPNKVQVGFQYENFDDIEDWRLSSFDYRRSTRNASFIGRVNWADRFNDTGVQFELDSYPNLAQKTYAYLNVGYSSSNLFPDWRYGAELYHNFPRSWEASLGGRHLDFGSSDTTIYTGSIARYFSNWWISLRPNYVPHSTGDDSFSAGLSLRRFLRGRYEYFEVTVRGGLSKPANVLPVDARDELDGTVRLELNKRLSKKLLLNTVGGVRREVLDNGIDRDSWFFGVGFEHLF